MNEPLLFDSSFDDESMEEFDPTRRQLNEAENAHIQVMMNLLEVKIFCEDLALGIRHYIDSRKKISRRRQQDINALGAIIADRNHYHTKEECMMHVRERLERVQSGWFIFRGNSLLRDTLLDTMKTHQSSTVARFRRELMHEYQAHKITLNRFAFVNGENIETLKQEVVQLRHIIEKHQGAASSNTTEKPERTQSLASRLKNVFG